MSKTLTKKDIALVIGDRLKRLSRRDAAKALDCVLEEMLWALETDGALKLRGFGSFAVREKPPRQGRNPRSGVTAPITARKVILFKASENLKTAMNGQAEPK
jgi:integration host factor subunit alpha